MATKLYSYFRSSCSYRVRIALHLKGVDFDYQAVHLVKNGGEQNREDFKNISPMSQVPCLEHNGRFIYQSLPILLYLEEEFPETTPLFPKSNFEKTEVLSFCEIINSFIQPLQNLSVLQYVEKELKGDKLIWCQKWMTKGFQSLETILREKSGEFCFGDKVTAADLFLIPQVYNARRFQVDMSNFKLIEKIEKNCLSLDAFQKAAPENQPDAPKN